MRTNHTTTTKFVLLGTGTPNAEPDRSGPAAAVVVNETPYLIDFGPGIVRRANAAAQCAIKGLTPPNLKRAFLTHLHSDHTAGFPDLILTPWTLGRDEPLHVYGPPGLYEMSEHIQAAYRQDIAERLHGKEPANPNGYSVVAHEIRPGLIYQDKNVSVEAFPVSHGSWPAFGYKFQTPDRCIVISGDAKPTDRSAGDYLGCDLLVHEVYSAVKLAQRRPDWQTYHSSVHTSSHELAQLCAQVRPELLVLYHQLFMGASASELLAEIGEIYDGPVVSGKDLDVY